MNEEKNINYSAADIHRYHKGQMTAKEMHALEKAALDDPFLADAIEGYTTVPVNAENDIDLLKKKLDERINKKRKIIPITKSRFGWLRIAALLIIIAGTGLVTYRYVLRSEKAEVATIEKADKAINKNITLPKPDTIESNPVQPGTDKKEEAKKPNVSEKKNDGLTSDGEKKPADKLTVTKNEEVKRDLVAEPAQSAAAPPKEAEQINTNRNEAAKQQDAVEYKKSVAKQKTLNNADTIKEIHRKDFKARTLNEVAVNQNIAIQNDKINIFHGQILDINNSPLPFANVTNIEDNVGTYTDAKGNFVLISPDSVLNVRIRSVGYENNTALLQNKLSNNAVIMQQDTKNIPSTVLNNRKINTERKQQDNNMKFEEPEPADGWYNYDTYIANNIKITDEIKTKTSSSSAVELSFDVNKYGEPVNIKVEKSVCKECDEEAIRLLKEGPKWKKKKNHRAKVAVPFLQEDQ
ncbi:MAG: carboxypeptidase-like regulatory domain-containing protein [Bacteroidota bacterium]